VCEKFLKLKKLGVGRVLIPTRGHTLWYSLYTYTYFVLSTLHCYSPTLSGVCSAGSTARRQEGSPHPRTPRGQ
jgi:hypothetical protein